MKKIDKIRSWEEIIGMLEEKGSTSATFDFAINELKKLYKGEK